jgi:hypothetical protein
LAIDVSKLLQTIFSKVVDAIIKLPWFEIIDKFQNCWRKSQDDSSGDKIYETLQYESTLEIHNNQGTRATFKKQKNIRYLQDGIIAFQDYAWGDGEILLNYRTSRGKAVDRYRAGFKTYVLISLREVKNKGDVDEFNIQWNIRNGFLTEDGYWSTDVSQRTKHLKANIIFPKSRPPLRLMLEESNGKRTRELGSESKKRLPDGRWRATWETNAPRLYEVYVLRWIW